jgi:N-acetylglutamate synthase-like GNAT family acetyltransferase
MSAAILIRSPKQADLPALAALLAAEQFGDDAARRLCDGYEHIRQFSLIAMSEGQLKGALIATFNGWHVFASHLVVVASSRRQGIARQLVENLFDRAREAGAKGIIADARLSAAGFCHALGFRLPGAVFLIRDL